MKAIKYEIMRDNMWLITGAIAIGLIVLFQIIGLILCIPLLVLHFHIKDKFDSIIIEIRQAEWKN